MPGCSKGVAQMRGMFPAPALLWRKEGKEDNPLTDLCTLRMFDNEDAPHPGLEGVAL